MKNGNNERCSNSKVQRKITNQEQTWTSMEILEVGSGATEK